LADKSGYFVDRFAANHAAPALICSLGISGTMGRNIYPERKATAGFA
jgi:hypothetical protein